MNEAELYEHMWSLPWYRNNSPGERHAAAVDVAPGTRVICVGCGTGREGLVLAGNGAVVTLQDLAVNCRDEEAKALPFIVGDAANIEGEWDLVYCADMLEHLPQDRVGPVLRRLTEIAPRAYLVIACRQDNGGVRAGVGRLHKTIKPTWWWHQLALAYWGHAAERGRWRYKIALECWRV